MRSILAWVLSVGCVSFAIGQSHDLQVQVVDEPKAKALMTEAGRAHAAGDFPRAAQLFEDAATHLPPTNPALENTYRMAASVQFHLGRTERAKTLFARAAEAARARGATARAADAYVDAAFVALRTGDRNSARRFIEHARRLARQSDVSPEDRARVLRRLSQPLAALAPVISVK